MIIKVSNIRPSVRTICEERESALPTENCGISDLSCVLCIYEMRFVSKYEYIQLNSMLMSDPCLTFNYYIAFAV
jgi:hypothetical protein